MALSTQERAQLMEKAENVAAKLHLIADMLALEEVFNVQILFQADRARDAANELFDALAADISD